jgi:hypothetical protein
MFVFNFVGASVRPSTSLDVVQKKTILAAGSHRKRLPVRQACSVVTATSEPSTPPTNVTRKCSHFETNSKQKIWQKLYTKLLPLKYTAVIQLHINTTYCADSFNVCVRRITSTERYCKPQRRIFLHRLNSFPDHSQAYRNSCIHNQLFNKI